MKCAVVMAEVSAWVLHEWPDAIGWTAKAESIMVECKTTVSDFYADRKKEGRRRNGGMGQHRYYMTERGVLKPKMIPDGWGLIEIRGSRTKIVVPAARTQCRRMEGGTNSRDYEMMVLVNRLRYMAGDCAKERTL